MADLSVWEHINDGTQGENCVGSFGKKKTRGREINWQFWQPQMGEFSRVQKKKKRASSFYHQGSLVHAQILGGM